MKIPENVRIAIYEMFLCSNLTEHFACYQRFYEELKECTFVVFSENEGSQLPKPLCTNYDNEFAIINIGCANHYYAINRQIYAEMIRTGKSDYYIDVCVELDTQAVSFLKNIFVEYNQVPDCNKMQKLIQYLQLTDVSYSCFPYVVENAAKKGVVNKIECYRNIKSFMLFNAFNYDAFLRYERCEYKRQEEDIQLETDGLYNKMFSKKFIKDFEEFYRMQKTLYVLLIKTICIEFANAKKSPHNKLMELIDFVNEKLGVFTERELQVCYYYFKRDEKNKEIL